MAWVHRLWLRLQRLFLRKGLAKELDGEMQFHLDELIAENIGAGMSREEARSAALRTFGNATALKEEAREAWGWTCLEQLLQDVRYAIRQLRKTPGFTATAVLTLALGIGANAAIFTLMDALMMRSLPVADPKTLVRLGDTSDCCVNSGSVENGSYALFSTEMYERLKKYAPEFEDLASMQAGFPYRPVVARRDGTQENARSVMGEFVSGNYFQTFGLRPAAGRLFSDSDDVKGAAMVAVMSYTAWKRDYAGDTSVIRSTFWINTKAVTLVGIAPEGFFGDRLSTSPPDFYLPIETHTLISNAPYVHDPDVRWLYIVGRVKPATQLGRTAPGKNKRVRKTMAERNKNILLDSGQEPAGKNTRGLDAGRRRHSGPARTVSIEPRLVDGCVRPRAADRLCQHCQPAAGSGHAAKDGGIPPRRARRCAKQNRPPASHRKRSLGGTRRNRRAGCRLSGSAHAFEAGVLRGGNHSH